MRDTLTAKKTVLNRLFGTLKSIFGIYRKTILSGRFLGLVGRIEPGKGLKSHLQKIDHNGDDAENLLKKVTCHCLKIEIGLNYNAAEITHAYAKGIH